MVGILLIVLFVLFLCFQIPTLIIFIATNHRHFCLVYVHVYTGGNILSQTTTVRPQFFLLHK